MPAARRTYVFSFVFLIVALSLADPPPLHARCPAVADDALLVHYTFDAFARAAGELGKDRQLAAKCRTLKGLLPDYPVAPDAKSRPVVVDWKGCKYKQVGVHNITVPATPVFPAEQVTWFSPEPVKELFRRIEDPYINWIVQKK